MLLGVETRPLPEVVVISDETGQVAGSLPLVIRPTEPAVRRYGRSGDASFTRNDAGPAVEVAADVRPPAAGWAGAVDHGLGYRRAGAATARLLVDSDLDGQTEISVAAPGQVPVERVRDLVTGYLLGALGQDGQSRSPRRTPPRLLVVATGEQDRTELEAEVAAGVEAARATAVARDLAGAPGNLKTPERLVTTMSEVLGAAGMTSTIISGEDLVSGGFGGVLAVGGGSAASPRVLVARRPGTGLRVLLVGKGITFDTGGISVKPADGMHLMRTDMAGSAAVVAAAAAFCADRSGEFDDLDLTVVVPSAENMISGSAYRPGDVVTHVDGTTSEVTNTDAEGRMVLADGIAHGIAVYEPDLVVDVATLTGAMKVALGMRTGAVMASDDDLAERISRVGADAGERWWRLPLLEEVRPAVSGTGADIRQAPSGPGAITAALFLERFTRGLPWAHLDIAGPARSPEEIDEVGPVATGFATRTLLGLLRDLAIRPRA